MHDWVGRAIGQTAHMGFKHAKVQGEGVLVVLGQVLIAEGDVAALCQALAKAGEPDVITLGRVLASGEGDERLTYAGEAPWR